MSEHSTLLVGMPISGNSKSQKAAQTILPVLVRQAMARQKITYGTLGEEIGVHHRALRHPLDHIGNTVLELGKRWSEEIPPIQTLVVNKETGLPGEGVYFLRGRVVNPRQKEAIVEEKLGKVFSYPKWLEVLEALGLTPAAPLDPQSDEPPTDHREGSAESEAHQRLKDYIASHPEAIRLGRSLAPGETEVVLPSGDKVDVLFRSARSHIAVEVKSHISNEADLRRGLFQCVKYRAILRACRSLEGGSYEADALLAFEGSLPQALIPVRNTLGVTVIENIRVHQG